tara:strand:+ start:203 stop:424 length:222 start_codon:yes stop_codon:yes gene_type:complete
MKGDMTPTAVLRKRMKQGGITLKNLAEATGKSEQTVCRVLNEDLVNKIMRTGDKLVRQANEDLTKELFECDYV